VDFTEIDGYLLGEPTTKAAAIAALLADRSPRPAAAPFYRALESVGERAADEALIALRIVVTGRELSDAGVRRIRALSALARAALAGDPARVRAARKRDAEVIADLPASSDRDELVAACKAAYLSELA
jgi:hypothetical protein